MIHPSALIDPSAKLGEGVTVGPWSIIGPHVVVGAQTAIGPHVVIAKRTRIGSHNRIHAFCALGGDPQHKQYQQEETDLVIGDHNTIREYSSIHRGSLCDGGQGETRIGHYNFIMSYVHIAHDCQIGDGITFVNHASLAGHVVVCNRAYIGAFSAIHQFCHIGAYSFISAALIKKDVPPYMLVYGQPTRVCGINRVGLVRAGFSPEVIQTLRRAYRIVYQDNLRVDESIVRLETMRSECEWITPLIESLSRSVRGIIR